MAEAGDLIKEFKGAKPQERAIIIIVIIAIVGIAIYWRSKTMSATGQGGPTASTGGPASPYPTVPSGSVPVLPSGTNPVYGPSGDLVGYQQGGGSPSPTQTSTAPSLTTVMTRGLWPGQSDPQGTGGVPVFQNPNANWGQFVTGIPLNQQIQVGAAVPGNYFGKSATYYPVSYNGQTGYIGSWDLKNAPANSPLPQGGGAFGTKVAARGRKTAPTREGHSYAARLYGRRTA